MPLIYETLRNIGKAKWYTKLDVRATFHKIRIAEGDEWMTAFRIKYGLFEWLVIPFGLVNALSTFQRYINCALRDFLDEFCSAYVDDILIYTDGSPNRASETGKKVLERLREAGLQLDVNKCEFEMKTTKYLGFIIEVKKSIIMDPANVEAIIKLEAPKTVKKVQGFLGFANFYRKFIKDFSQRVMPLTNLVKKDTKFDWSEATNEAFSKLKQIFVTAPLLVQFDNTRETVLETHVSIWCIGGTLSQYIDGILRPCAYYSKKNSPAECNYEIYDKEMLAIIRCLEEWDAELRSVKFEIRTDHKNLEYFMTVKKLTERQIRWSLILSKYDFVINYITGKSNERADALSKREQDVPKAGDDKLEYKMAQLLKPGMLNFEPRANERTELNHSETLNPIEIQPVATGESGVDFQPAMAEFQRVGTGESGAESQPIYIEEPERELENLWATARSNDDVYQSVVKAIKKGKRTLPTSLALKVFIGDCSLDNNETLLFRGKKWVPESEPLRTKLIQRTHDSLLTGHPGREITAALMFRNYFWPGMLLDIRRFVRNCDVCGRNKAWRDKKQGFLKPLPIPSRIWSEISIDFVVDLPENERCKNLLVITDKLKKKVILEPCDSMDAEAVSEIFIRRFYRQHGLPAAIVSDRGRQFVSILWKRICKILGIERRLSTAYHPQTDGATERMNQTVETFLRTYIDFDQRNWVKLLFITEFAINNKDATST